MTVLILSCGTRCKLVRFFQETLRGRTEGGRVIAADASPWAPALYEADAYYLVPSISDPGYPERILEICRKEGVNALLPLLEDELELMAENRELFERQGITVLVSGAETVALCRDKYRFFRHLTAHGIPVLPTCISLEAFWEARAAGKMDFPVFVKPVNGCGSVGVSRVENDALLRALWESSPEPLLIQQFAQGEEIGADIYVDLISHRPVAVFTKKKVRMRAGETEKSVSFRDPALFSLICRTADVLALRGPADMDLFRIGGAYYISEVNPRFGGGYPHAWHCGVNFPALILRNLTGIGNPAAVGDYEEGLCMMKYSDETVRRL